MPLVRNTCLRRGGRMPAAGRRTAVHKTVGKRALAAGALAVALITGLAGCSGSDRGSPSASPGGAGAKKAPAAAPPNAVRLIGDGSTASTGAQPHQPVWQRLKPGETPPQFVVFSWDGAGEDSQKLFSHFRSVGRKYDASMTYFLSGVYLLPEEKRELYDPPQHSAGRSDIGFNDVEGIRATVRELRAAWLEGNEIGTHFNGHFCGTETSVGKWSPEEWKSEINQAKSFVKNWKTNAGLRAEKPLPFDYDKELVGARTPCLEGRENFVQAAAQMGFRYDTSGVNDQIWPKKDLGLWDLSMQLVPMPGRAFQTLSMDYNFLVNQSPGTTQGDPSQHAYWGDQMRDGLVQAFERSYRGNRAPLIIGNHFESWNGGTYMRAIEETIATVCVQKDVKCVSFRQLADWLDAQDPDVVAKMRTLKVGEAPQGGWQNFLAARPPAPAGAPAAGAKQAERR
ncbi:Putative secreted protein [Streptomyces venezuelae]|nr:Putative secreted protein [Streptomyces venezuelae]